MRSCIRTPDFRFIAQWLLTAGASAVPYAVHEELGFSFKASEILSKLTDNTRLIILNSPGNPTGGSNLDSEVEALVAGLRDFPNCAVLVGRDLRAPALRWTAAPNAAQV